jgi:hypothetical protein
MNIQIDWYVRLIMAIVITFIFLKVIERLQEKGALQVQKVSKTFGIETRTLGVFVTTFCVTLFPILPIFFAIKPEWLFNKKDREKAVALAPDLLRWLRVSWVVLLGAQFVWSPLLFFSLFRQTGN